MQKIASHRSAAHGVLGVVFFWHACSIACVAQGGALTGLTPHHATISVENLDRALEWYERVLGFKLAHRSYTNPDFIVANLTIPGYRIDVVKFKGSSRTATVNPRYLQQGWIHLAFGVPDLPAAYKQLQALNTDVTEDTDASGAPTRVIVHDPEGNELEFFKPL